jgi:hypothetical protein
MRQGIAANTQDDQIHPALRQPLTTGTTEAARQTRDDAAETTPPLFQAAKADPCLIGPQSK